MIALGLTWAGERAADGVTLQTAGDFKMLVTPAEPTTSPRDRLRLQSAASAQLSSFLPFCAKRPPDVERAVVWATRRDAEIRHRLIALQGACQMTMDLSKDAPLGDLSPRDWLRQRAARLAVAKWCEEMLAPMVRESRVLLTPTGARIHVLLQRDQRSHFVRGVENLCQTARFTGVRAVLTGPWPAVNFQGEDLV